MARELTPGDVARLSELAGVRLPEEDVEAVAEALRAQLAFVEPLLEADLTETDSALAFDPRWRD